MTAPRPLRPVTGGTRARDVDALRSALAALLADPAGRGRTRGPVLVPVAPGEDAAALLARIEAAGFEAHADEIFAEAKNRLHQPTPPADDSNKGAQK